MGLAIGTLHVRRSIFIDASPERVWEEFTAENRISAWLDRGHTLHSIDPRLGGRAEMSVAIEGRQRFYSGQIIVYEPACEMSLEIVWREPWEATYATATPSYWTFRLTPVHSGTLLELFHHGFELTGANAADNLEGYEQGWDIKHLSALRAVVEA
jgi:uncharacterized protein YndB with AHSA1/START domain